MAQAFNWKKLQNGSDIRGVALEGIADEKVNLTPEVATRLGQAFVSWLSQKLEKQAAKLTVSIGRDSRLSGPKLMLAVMEGMTALGSKVYDFDIASTPAMFMSTVTPEGRGGEQPNSTWINCSFNLLHGTFCSAGTAVPDIE
ncbi:MAG: hypothetical protein AAGF26_10885, partial [Cyanobacteria bacterium P01_G01_bin.49]